MLSHVQLFMTPWTVVPRILCPRNFLGKNAGMGGHFLLQRIIPTQWSKPSLLCFLFGGGFLTSVPPGKPSGILEAKSKFH